MCIRKCYRDIRAMNYFLLPLKCCGYIQAMNYFVLSLKTVENDLKM